MPAWLIPALKAALPHIAAIISAAAPVFTRKNADAVANQTLLLQQQITELQSAAPQNDRAPTLTSPAPASRPVSASPGVRARRARVHGSPSRGSCRARD